MARLHSSDPLRSDSDEDLADLVGQLEGCLDPVDKPEVLLDFPEDYPVAVSSKDMVGVGWYRRGKLYMKEGMAKRIPHEVKITPGSQQGRGYLPLAVCTADRDSRVVIYKGERYTEFDFPGMYLGPAPFRGEDTDRIEGMRRVSGRGIVLLFSGDTPPEIGTWVRYEGREYTVTGIEHGGEHSPHGLLVKEVTP